MYSKYCRGGLAAGLWASESALGLHASAACLPAASGPLNASLDNLVVFPSSDRTLTEILWLSKPKIDIVLLIIENV